MQDYSLKGPVKVLLIEDNPGDIRLIQEAMKECDISITLYVVKDGVDAMSFLHHQEALTSSPNPDLILLDLNLPRKNGFELLNEIKQDEKLKRIPVIILTSSSDEEDVFKSYGLHANFYITKPVKGNEFVQAIKSINENWLRLIKLPSHR